MALQDVLDKVLGRVSRQGIVAEYSFMDAANAVQQIITRRLLLKKSDLLLEDFTAAIVAPASTFTLPTGFKGFAERPYLSGTSTHLMTLPRELRSQLTTPGTPKFYEMRGTTVKLFPTPSANVTVVGVYYKEPTAFTTLTATMPFGGLADDIFVEGITRLAVTGMKTAIDPEFLAMIYNQLEEILSSRAPRQVYFKQVIEGGQNGIGSRDYWEV